MVRIEVQMKEDEYSAFIITLGYDRIFKEQLATHKTA